MNWNRFKKSVSYKLNDLVGRNHKYSYKKYYSQYGEDIIVQSLFKNYDYSKLTYLDIGCNHPFRFNNTALLYLNGASGFCIDADQVFFSDYKKYRARDICFNIGIADTEGDLSFYVMNNSTLSTFSEQEYLNYIRLGYTLKKIIEVPVMRLDSFIKNHCNGIFPDFLSLDVEGLDLDILQSYNWESTKPKVICVEGRSIDDAYINPSTSNITRYLSSVGYALYSFNNLNSIFVDPEYLRNK